MKIGAVTIGQAPRDDVTCDLMHIFGDKVELLQRGALDGLTLDEIRRFAPADGDYVLVSRLLDGTSVTFAEKHILPRLQQAINELEASGVELIIFFCTGSFPDSIQSSVPLIYPCDILHRIVPLLTRKSDIIAITPSQMQVRQNEEKWSGYVRKCSTLAASPYGSWAGLQSAAKKAKELSGDLIVLDCIGFDQKMKNLFARESGKHVVLPRTLLARVVSEIADIDYNESRY